MGAKVLLLGRNASTGEDVLRRMERAGHGGSAFIQTDLSSLAEVRKAAVRAATQCDRIDVLINNAGARYDRFAQSADGVELTFATNHLGHFLLTALLLERVLDAERGRIITVSSGAHHAATPGPSWDMRAEHYDRRQAYARSKLANLLFAYQLAERLQHTAVTSNGLTPGGVASNFARNNGLFSWMRHGLSHLLRRELITPATAARALLKLAAAPEFACVTGCYFFLDAVATSSPTSYNRDAALSLWSTSVRLCKLDARLGRAWEFVKPEAEPHQGQTSISTSAAWYR